MKRNTILIALAVLLIPAVLRGLWFYRGVAERPEIATPDFASFSAPQAPVHEGKENPEDIKKTGGVVLFDTIHGNQFMMSDAESLTGDIKQRGGQVELLIDPILLEYKLKYASAFVVISPTIPYTADETRILKNFVSRGGRLLVFTDATRNVLYFDYISGNPIVYGDVNAANSVLAPFDISINNDYLYNLEENEGNFRNVFFDDFAKNELTFGLKEVALYGTHSVESPSGLLLLRGTESNLSSANDANDPAQGGAALSKDGNVAAFGDFTFLASPYNNYTDNASLIANLADFALSGRKITTLDNFPFMFKDGTVQVYLTSEVTKTAEMVAALGRLQASLKFVNIQVELADEFPKDGDAIIISSFAPVDEITPFINKFDVTLEEGSEFINAPGFGEIGIYGNGIILFDAGSKGNKFVLLANSMEDTVYVLDTLSSGYLYGCLLQDNMAVCSVGYGSSSYETPTPDAAQDSTGEEATPQPEGTPVPQG